MKLYNFNKKERELRSEEGETDYSRHFLYR